ncbi:LytR C-terminal domain-containing protein [Streptomyces sp. NPDC059828]|uniref:LytR C-terminal domain-containing protein n=1 Tax=Streptomyces sp. NPDC059828 TaxID=3346965 RepID=UPI00366245E8
MSMLTPPGMGGKYRITGNAYPRMRRPRRRRYVLGALAAVTVVGVGGWGTMQLIDVFSGGGEKPATHTQAAACAAQASPAGAPLLPRPAQVKVNVYNATPRPGLAKTTADELRKRGFVVGNVGNAPAAYDKKVPGTGMLLGAATAHEGALRVLATQLTGAELRVDARKTPDVDLIIGTGFKALTAKTVSDKALAALAAPPKPAGQC